MEFVVNKISKKDFFKINEKDVMFITNPGRMGDEDGSTFIIKQDDNYKIYRLDEWMYRTNNFNESEHVSLDDAFRQFPKWKEAWKKQSKEKYTYLNMGFGNGLSVDNLIFDEYKKYLDKEVRDFIKDNDDLKIAAIFNVWENAFINMVNKNNY